MANTGPCSSGRGSGECTHSCRQVAADMGGLMASNERQAPVSIRRNVPIAPASGPRIAEFPAAQWVRRHTCHQRVHVPKDKVELSQYRLLAGYWGKGPEREWSRLSLGSRGLAFVEVQPLRAGNLRQCAFSDSRVRYLCGNPRAPPLDSICTWASCHEAHLFSTWSGRQKTSGLKGGEIPCPYFIQSATSMCASPAPSRVSKHKSLSSDPVRLTSSTWNNDSCLLLARNAAGSGSLLSQSQSSGRTNRQITSSLGTSNCCRQDLWR